ncbi:TPA: hypothetical protein DEP90_02070 [Patescibacteria group bacterium]|nr:hypothetical protein [Patescibacteria group bacterium]
MKIPTKKIPIILISISLFLVLILLSHQYSSSEISTYISDTGIYTPMIYILIQIAGQIFAPLSTSALFVAGYLLFGQTATLYSIIVWTITSITNFYIARKYGNHVLKFFLGQDGVEEVRRITKKLTDKHLIILRLLTFYINDFASYAFGLTKISFKKYFLATIVSMIPWSIVMSILSKDGDTLLMITLKIFLTMIPFAIANYIFFKSSKS